MLKRKAVKMVYLLKGSKPNSRVMLVKCVGQDEMKERLKLDEDEVVIGTLTDAEVHVLEHSPFALVTA